MADETPSGFAARPSGSDQGPPGSSASAAQADQAAHDPFAERPEVYVGAAFAGGLVLAGLLRILGR